MSYAEPQNMTGLSDIFTYANDVSGNMFGVGTIISLYIIVFAFLKGRGSETSDCMIAAGYISVVCGIFFFMLGLLNNQQMFLTVMMCILPALWAQINKAR